MNNQQEREQVDTMKEPDIAALDDQAVDQDTTGFAFPSAELWKIAPQVALKLSLIDPPPPVAERFLPGSLGSR